MTNQKPGNIPNVHTFICTNCFHYLMGWADRSILVFQDFYCGNLFLFFSFQLVYWKWRMTQGILFRRKKRTMKNIYLLVLLIWYTVILTYKRTYVKESCSSTFWGPIQVNAGSVTSYSILSHVYLNVDPSNIMGLN